MRGLAVLGVLVLAATGAAAPAAVASASSAKCWAGTWKVTSTSIDIKSKDLVFKASGGKNIKLTLAAGKATYAFKGSSPLTGSGSYKGVATKATLTLTKTLKMATKITGSGKGTLTGTPKTATGDAVLTVKTGLITQKINAAKAVRGSQDRGVVPRSATYTCAGKKLTIKQTINKSGTYSKSVWNLRRA